MSTNACGRCWPRPPATISPSCPSRRRPPTRRYVLSYLVSAWAKTPDEEHRMLGRVLAAAPHREALPAELVTGVFAEEDEPVLVRVAVPGAGAGADSWDLWPSLGHPLRT